MAKEKEAGNLESEDEASEYDKENNSFCRERKRCRQTEKKTVRLERIFKRDI